MQDRDTRHGEEPRATGSDEKTAGGNGKLIKIGAGAAIGSGAIAAALLFYRSGRTG